MADNLTTCKCRLSGYLGAPAFWNPKGLSGPVMELLYLLGVPQDVKNYFRGVRRRKKG
jgi:hypothetical protein